MSRSAVTNQRQTDGRTDRILMQHPNIRLNPSIRVNGDRHPYNYSPQYPRTNTRKGLTYINSQQSKRSIKRIVLIDVTSRNLVVVLLSDFQI